MESFEKYSITPFRLGSLGNSSVDGPFSLGDIRIEPIEGLFRNEHFATWKDMVSSDSVNFFVGAKVALVHEFRSGYVTGKNEENSKTLLEKAFHCLRIVKPTRTRFSVVQYRKSNSNGIDVFSVVWPGIAFPMNVPQSEVLNQITIQDLQELRALWPSFRTLRDSGPAHLRRAMRYYETGYDALADIDLQFTTWLMGIEALYGEGEDPVASELIKERILKSIGPSTDIYEEFERRDLYAPNPLFVKDLLDGRTR